MLLSYLEGWWVGRMICCHAGEDILGWVVEVRSWELYTLGGIGEEGKEHLMD